MSQATVKAADQRRKIDLLLRDPKVPARDRYKAVWAHILEVETKAGTQFLKTNPDGLLYAVLNDGKVFSLPSPGKGGHRWFAYLNAVYGLVEGEPSTNLVYRSLRSHVENHGTEIELRRFAAYDLVEQTAYMSAYNGKMYKIDGTDINEYIIGEDGIFFADDDNGKHVTPNLGDHGVLFDRLTKFNFAPSGLAGITPAQQRMAILTWIFALAFPDMMPTKPILIVEGPAGSGKSAGVALIQLALMGMTSPMILQENKGDDFGVVLLRSPIAIFDNQDTYVKWVPDAICSYATSGVWKKRKLFTDAEDVLLRPHAFIAIASKNPASFRREDTADRCVVIRLERREDFTTYDQLKADIVNERNILLGEYLWYVNKIVAELRANRASGVAAPTEKHRMADFAAFSRVVGRVVGWTADDVAGMMAALQSERDAFANEEDPLLDLLERWVGYEPRGGSSNKGRLIPLYTLHKELESLAQGNGIPWIYSPKVLAQKLRSPHIDKELRIELYSVKGTKSYRIWRHSELEVEVDNADNVIPLIFEE